MTLSLRNLLFLTAYWATSIITAILALPLLLWPSRKPLMRWVRGYSRMMVHWMRIIGGIELEVRGREHMPAGAAIIAAKHQSWGDGFCMFSQFDDLAFISGDHLDKLPLIGRILRKMGAVMVTGCGNVEDRAKVTQDGVGKARQDGRAILIYPEGRLTPVGHYAPYKKGVFHMMEAYDAPVVPVATNLGLFWPRHAWDLKPGKAVIEFLEPIQPGLGKDAFMALLLERIETASLALLPADFVLPKERMWADPSDAKAALRESVSA
jgi:1-acyl-sn-glycerol-3-phosphate acyltransferase